jgi:hypothetical protein
MKRENIIGRANVEDAPELEAYYRERCARSGYTARKRSPSR